MNTPDSTRRPPFTRAGDAPTGPQGLDHQRRSLLSAFGAWALGPSVLLARPAAARNASPQPLPIPLAMDAPDGIHPLGYLVSEKLDGVRAVWDGQSLRFRSGHGIVAPDWFLKRLPPIPLDGELWFGRGRFEALSGAVRRLRPSDDEWRAIRFCIFELPHGQGNFAARTAELESRLHALAFHQLLPVQQTRVASQADLMALLNRVVAQGGEGLMLRASDALYRPGRSQQLLKLKPVQDAEATVLGHERGKGRLADRLGALRVRTDEGVEFKIGTGFSDGERLQPPAIGARITFQYRGLTEDGVPRFASFLRERPAGV